MTATEQKQAAHKFTELWLRYKEGKNEIEITQKFWMNLLRTVYGVQNVEEFIDFERKVRVDDKPKRIDGYIPSTKVLIEQKKRGTPLDKKIHQSDSEELTPYEQAKRYADNLRNELRPNWIVVCNFDEFRIHDLNSDTPSHFETVRLSELATDYHRMKFLQDISSTKIYKETEVSRKAGKLIGEIYAELEKQYGSNMTDMQKHELNVLCVRLVFCLYAEDAEIFEKNQFGDYLRDCPIEMFRYKLNDLFAALGTKNRESLFIDPRAKSFKYVNGGLFNDTSISIPPITQKVKDLLVNRASDELNWSGISPTIFGAMFESTLNPETRHDGGMHYTSVENIHKVIGPLFLDALQDELEDIFAMPEGRSRRNRLLNFQDKLASITCMDPACGSGNFLTETYISLRRMENRILRDLHRNDTLLIGEFNNPVKVSIEQFHGIEINDFAVSVAKTAMWIAENQMRTETEDIVKLHDDFLPLTRHTNVQHGDALRMEWSDLVSPDKLSYIIGNPPFLGYSNQSKEQREDLQEVFVDEKGKPYKNVGKLDFVAAWYMKSAQMMQQNPKIRTALVSTNSITQGEQVAILWRPLVERFGLQIHFAWRTFVWDGDANVHCIIIGFGKEKSNHTPRIFDGEACIEAKHINAYLLDMEDVWVENNKKQISGAPKMCKGSQPTGNFNVSEEERQMLQQNHPELMPYIRRFMGATEFINNQFRYCFWLKEASPNIIRRCPWLMNRIEDIKKQREKSTKAATRKKAETPTLFDEDRQPDSDYLLVPRHSSEKREYIPIGFMTKDVICGDANLLVADATLYHFGVLTSSLHMAWTAIIGGKIKSDPRYSNDIVYNNFPWPEVTESQKDEIMVLAQKVLDERNRWTDSSLADLYDVNSMPPELRKAHKNLDKAVLKLYGLKPDTDEMNIVKHLLMLYKRIKEEE